MKYANTLITTLAIAFGILTGCSQESREAIGDKATEAASDAIGEVVGKVIVATFDVAIDMLSDSKTNESDAPEETDETHKMVTCPKCGNTIIVGAKFCSECGAQQPQ